MLVTVGLQRERESTRMCVCVIKWAEIMSIKFMSTCVLWIHYTAHTEHVSNVIMHSMQSCIPQRSIKSPKKQDNSMVPGPSQQVNILLVGQKNYQHFRECEGSLPDSHKSLQWSSF